MNTKNLSSLVVALCGLLIFGGVWVLGLTMASCSNRQAIPSAPSANVVLKAADIPADAVTMCGNYIVSPGCVDESVCPPVNCTVNCNEGSSCTIYAIITPVTSPRPIPTATLSPTPTPKPITCVITGPSNLMFFCANGGQVITLQSTVSPSGGTYNWQIISGTNEVQINGSNTASGLTLQAIGPSSSPNDIEVQLTYTQGSQNAGSTHNLTVQQPSKVVVVRKPTITAQQLIGGQGECIGLQWGTLTLPSQIVLQVQDQFGNSIQGISLSEKVTVDTTQTSSILVEDGVQNHKITTGNAPSLPNGYFADDYEIGIKNDSRLCNNQDIQLVETQELNFGGCVGVNTFILSPTDVQTSYPLNLQ